MAKRKKRTSIRTAAGTASQLYLERVRALRDDPLRVLPVCPDGEPKPVAKVRARLAKMSNGKAGFLDRRDRGIVGAVANILNVADQDSVSHLVDQKIAGQRRFYLQRGDVERPCSIGVQNHDQPLALLMAWRPMAKKQSLHFFADPGLWCTGPVPEPPAEWLEGLGRDEVQFTEEEGGYGCGHPGTGRIALGFRGGPTIAVCSACARRTGNLHQRVAARYAGPRQRQPVQVWFETPDGGRMEVDAVAAYRAGAKTEPDLVRTMLEQWRDAASSGRRFILGERDFGSDQDAFLDALSPTPWERAALTVMTAEGHRGRRAAVEAVLRKNKSRLVQGVAAIVGPEAAGAMAKRPASDLRGLLRLAHNEAERRIKTAILPDIAATGPVARVLDDAARARLVDGPRGVITVTSGSRAPAWLRCALVMAVGGDAAQDGGFAGDAQDAAEPWVERLQEFFTLEGDAYSAAIARLVKDSGSGERVQ